MTAVGEHLVQLALVDFLHGGQINALALVLQHPLRHGVAHLHAEVDIFGAFQQHRTDLLREEIAVVIIVDTRANLIANSHLEQAFRHTAQTQRPRGNHLARANGGQNGIIIRGQRSGVVRVAGDKADGVPRFLEFGRNDLARLAGGNREGAERRRNVHLLERARHGVLAANRRDVQIQLRIQRAQQRRERLAPARRIRAHALEIFLEGQIRLLVVKARADQLRHALDDRQIAALIRRLRQDFRVHPVRHAGHGIRHAMTNRQLCNHRLVRGQLIFAAEGHQDRRRADGRIEPLAQALLGADIEVAKHIRQLLRHRIARELVGLDIIIRDRCSRVLLRAVGIEELAGQIDNRHALPRHAQTGFGGHFRHDGRFKVLAVCRRKERINILRRKHNRHPFLRFGNRQLRAVQTVVLLRHFVQINQQAVRQFADCHGHAARAEVVAALNQAGDFAVTEEALELAFGRGIALLHLRAARFDGFQLMGFRRTRCAAAAVAPGAPAKEDNLVAGGRHFAADVLLRRSADHRADFQTLGGIARMVHFIHQPRCQSNLVAIGGIARRRRGDELALG